jgi:hypothetical protein
MVDIVGENRSLVDAESDQRFRVRGYTVAEGRAITPVAHSAKHSEILIGTAAVEDEGAMNASVGSNNEADSHL